jgi:hypothetical protein
MGGTPSTFPFSMFETWDTEQPKTWAVPLTSKISFSVFMVVTCVERLAPVKQDAAEPEELRPDLCTPTGEGRQGDAEVRGGVFC